MLARRHLLWLLAMVALVAAGTKWGPARLGSDIPLGGDIPLAGVAWTRVSLNMTGHFEEKMLVEFTKSSDIRPVIEFLEQRSSGWKKLTFATDHEATPTQELLLNSAHGDLIIGLVLSDTRCAMWWWKGGQTWCRAISTAESRDLLGLFGMKWDQKKFEVVRQ